MVIELFEKRPPGQNANFGQNVVIIVFNAHIAIKSQSLAMIGEKSTVRISFINTGTGDLFTLYF